MENDRLDTNLIITAPEKKQSIIAERIGCGSIMAGARLVDGGSIIYKPVGYGEAKNEYTQNGTDLSDVYICDNVYQATADVYKVLSESDLSEYEKLVVVLVWADNLTLGQMEFFTILKENPNVVTLAISANNETKLQTALKAGADRAMFLDNLMPGLFDSLCSSEKQGLTPLVTEDCISDEELDTYELSGDDEFEVKSEILEIPAEKSKDVETSDVKKLADENEKESQESEVSDSNGLTDIALSDDELRSLLDDE